MSREFICSTCAGNPRWTTEFYRATAQDTGALVIEKRLRPGHPFGRSLPERERRTTLHLAKNRLPVARLCPPDYDDAWSVISEFVGPNLRWMTLHEQTTATDAAALWHAATLATAKIAAANVMVTDWAARNVAYPLTDGLSGRACFSDPRLLDHAFTQSGADGADVQKGNIWMQADQSILAPEVRRILREEQVEALAQVKAMTGGAVTDLAALAARPDCEELFGRIHLGKVSLQSRLRDGSLDPNRAMQHAIGHDALMLLALNEARVAELDGIRWLQHSKAVLEKMCAELPADRFDSLTEAAQALVGGQSTLPAESSFSLPALNLEALIRRPTEATRPLEAASPHAVHGDAGTLPVDSEATPSARPARPMLAGGTEPPAPLTGMRLRAAGLALGLATLVGLSMPDPGNVEEASIAVARRGVTGWAAQAAHMTDPAALRDLIRGLVHAAGDPRHAVSREATRQLALMWRSTQEAMFRALLSQQPAADADVEALASRVRAFAVAGYKPAAEMARMLDGAVSCGGTGRCLRQAFGGLQAAPPDPLALSRRAAGNSG